jgi:hypothetical protein
MCILLIFCLYFTKSLLYLTMLRKKFANLQSSDQTHLDIRNRTVGMRQQIQCNNHTEITIKNPQNHSKCPLVYTKPHTPHRAQHPLCAEGGVRHPQHTQTCSSSSTIASDSSNGVTIPDAVDTVVCALMMGGSTTRNM